MGRDRQTDRPSGASSEAWALRHCGSSCPLSAPAQVRGQPGYLDGKGAQHYGAEDGVSEDAIEDIALAMDLAGVDLIEELHHDEGVEDDGVVL